MIADDGDVVATLDGLLWTEVAAEGGLDAKDVQQVGLGDDPSDEQRVIRGVKTDAGGALPEESEV